MNEENSTGTVLDVKTDTKQDTGKPTASPPVPPRPRKKKSKAGRIIATVLILAVLAGGTYYVVTRLTKKTTATIKYTEVAVTRGNIAKTITGSGAVQPQQEYTVVPSVTGQIIKDYITQGQKIKQNDPLYDIDPTNANNAIAQAQNALQRAQLSYQQSADSLSYLNVASDISGVVTKVYVKNGDQINANGAIIDVQDTSSLLLTIPFNASDATNITVGESALVTLEATGTIVNGSVSRVYTGTQIGANGALVTNIDIKLQNPGVIQSGATATAIVGGQYACNSAGTFAYIAQKTVTAKTSGQVTGLTLQVGDAVKNGDTIATLSNDSASVSAQTAQLQVQNAQLQLQNSQNALKNYNLTSPISGTVIEKDMKAGDTISNTTSSSNTMAVIADMSSLKLTINVDELDILSIKTGQAVNITADAVPGKTFTGSVSSISVIGNSGSSSSSTGVTTYAVQITITDYGSLLPGMNVNASIVVNSASNVLLVPEQAVLNGGFVLKKVSAATASGATASGASSPAASASASPAASAPVSGGNGQPGSGQNGGPSGNGQYGGNHTGNGQYSGGQNPGSHAGGQNGAAGASAAPGNASPGTSAAPGAAGASGAGNANAAMNARMKQLQATLPKGYELIRVQVGLTDGSFAEITSGLADGDTIAYVSPATSSSTASSGAGGAFAFGGAAGGNNRQFTAPAGGVNVGGGANFGGGASFGGGAARPNTGTGNSSNRGG